jgi:hypothetical protein
MHRYQRLIRAFAQEQDNVDRLADIKGFAGQEGRNYCSRNDFGPRSDS